MDLVEAVYDLTENLPSSEVYGITSQMRRAAVSIPSNIAEGQRRNSRKDYCQFVAIAFGSGAELETQIEILRRLKLGKNLDYRKIEVLLNEVMRMLNRLLSSLKDH